MNIPKRELKSWKRITSKDIFSAEPWLKLSVSTIQLPDGREINNYYELKLPDCAGVVAETTDGKIIMERQYKLGVGHVSLVLPGGALKDGEDALSAVQRELLEETGYVASDWFCLGDFIVDANHNGGRVFIYTAHNAHQIKEPDSGDLEDIDIVLMEPEEIVNAVKEGEIAVLGAAAALAMALNPIFINKRNMK